MKKRKEKIKEIESLIEKNKCSRRKFIDSLGKTVALSSLSTIGLSFIISCEKEMLSDNTPNLKGEGECNESPYFCKIDYGCEVSYPCPILFDCLKKNTCIPVSCGFYLCSGKVSHNGGSAS